MKKLVIIFALTLSLVSCSSDESKGKKSVDTNYYGKWTLEKMYGGRTAFVCGTPDGSLGWKETYVFNTDGTFSKTRIDYDITITAVGTFKIATSSKETHFELNYKETSPIIGSCNGNQTENLYINEDNLLESAWVNCDGWGLIYKKG